MLSEDLTILLAECSIVFTSTDDEGRLFLAELPLRVEALEAENARMRACHEAELGVCQTHCDVVLYLTAEIERLRAAVENHGTFRWMDMTPNDDLPRRILSAYLDYSEWTDNTAGLEPTNPLILAMNQHREQRNALIEAALAALEARDE